MVRARPYNSTISRTIAAKRKEIREMGGAVS